jgi:predicted GIY-YIG superfamily endonuclease
VAFVYLLASKPNGTLYIGSTFDLARRVSEHKLKAVPGFTANTVSIDSSGMKCMKRSTAR